MASRWVERLLAAHEPPLTPARYLALEAVAKGEVVGAELARQAAVSPAAASQLLGGLEADGLVERLKAADDRRRQPLALTTQGDDVLRSAQTLLSERLAVLLGDLPRPEAEALARLLHRVESLLTGTAPPRRPPRPPHRPPRRGH
jgi:DNA-binding MarR family transcriptional regulator